LEEGYEKPEFCSDRDMGCWQFRVASNSMTGTVAGGTSTTVAKDTKLNGPSVSIASGAVALMTKAARVGIVGNESCAGLRLFLIVPANF